MLERALHDIEHGVYVDVGAADPISDSVTAHFYAKGWSGIDIEPSPHCAALLRVSRPRDTIIEAAVSDVPGENILHEFSVPGWATIDERIVALSLKSARVISRNKVQLMTLNQIFDRYIDRAVHFLKIDCEGFEYKALRGIDLNVHRPWIILVEALEPHTNEPSHGQWEHLITENRYNFAYFDGLNRYYVAVEHSSRMASFVSPPNVFDQIVFAREVRAQEEYFRKLSEIARELAAARPFVGSGLERKRKGKSPAARVGAANVRGYVAGGLPKGDPAVEVEKLADQLINNAANIMLKIGMTQLPEPASSLTGS